jgi:hypothetical protein
MVASSALLTNNLSFEGCWEAFIIGPSDLVSFPVGDLSMVWFSFGFLEYDFYLFNQGVRLFLAMFLPWLWQRQIFGDYFIAVIRLCCTCICSRMPACTRGIQSLYVWFFSQLVGRKGSRIRGFKGSSV